MDNNELSKQTKEHLLALAKQKGLKGVSRLRKTELVTRLAEAMPVYSPSVSHPSHITTVPDTQAGGQGGAAARAAGSSRALAVADQPSGSGAAQPVNEVQQAAIDAKFFLGPEDQPLPTPAPELPSTYNDNRLVLLARDPYWLYAYWDFSVEQISATLTRLGAQDTRPILRVFDVTYIDFDGTNAWSGVDIEITPFATNWYIPVPQPDAAYCVEVGYRAPDGRFAALGRSNVVTTPRAEVSPSTTLRWMTPAGRPVSAVPPPQRPPLPFSAIAREPGSWPLGPAGREALPPLPAPSSAQHPFSWSFGRKV
jgi:hypothetical protein